MNSLWLVCLSLGVLVAMTHTGQAAEKLIDRSGPHYSKWLPVEADGTLKYVPDENGELVLDYSNAGYMGGGVAIPDVPVVKTLSPQASGDDAKRIQAAIDEVAAMPLNGDGFRGALLLKAGTYRIGETLFIRDSGIVLRGEGAEEGGTLLKTTMRVGKDASKEERAKMLLLKIEGPGDVVNHEEGAVKITDSFVPTSARSFNVEAGHPFKVGDTVIVERIGNKDWIHAIRMDRIKLRTDGKKKTKQWKPFNLEFECVVTAVDGTKLTVDVPITCSIDERWGGGRVYTYDDSQRIEQVGVEYMRFEAEYDTSIKAKRSDDTEYDADENQCRSTISVNNMKNGWIRNITQKYFVSGMSMGGGSKWITIQDCVQLQMVSTLEGGRRYPFNIAGGKMILYQRCYSETARHALALGSRNEGPNAFVDCIAVEEYSDSEPHHRWSVGGLFDNVHASMKVQDRQNMGSGHGWQGANYMFWNTRGNATANSPATARNMVVGHIGSRGLGTHVYAALKWMKDNPGEPLPDWARIPQGIWESHGRHVSPRSLYLAQLEDRLGADALKSIASPSQISGSPLEDILAYAEKQGAVYTEQARERVKDTRSWVRVVKNRGETSFDDAVIKTESGLLEYELKNHWEYPPGEGPASW